MKVIVASYSKCGTKTMAAALRQLGYVVYDFMENFEYLGDKWIQMLEQGTTPEELRSLYEGVDAVTDVPCAIFWEELLQAFPDAKIILSQRQSEDEWARSLRNQHEKLMHQFRIPMLLSKTARKFKFYLDRWSCTDYGDSHVARMLFGKTRFNELTGRRIYRMHNNYIIMKLNGRRVDEQQKGQEQGQEQEPEQGPEQGQQEGQEQGPEQGQEQGADERRNVANDRLLQFKLSDGWQPLCEFLGKSIPKGKFPHMNKGASLTTLTPPDDLPGGKMTADKINRETKFVLFFFSLCLLIAVLAPCIAYFNSNR